LNELRSSSKPRRSKSALSDESNPAQLGSAVATPSVPLAWLPPLA
jgi:hypothetical protein